MVSFFSLWEILLSFYLVLRIELGAFSLNHTSALFTFLFWEMVLWNCAFAWIWIFLPQRQKWWDYKHAPPHVSPLRDAWNIREAHLRIHWMTCIQKCREWELGSWVHRLMCGIIGSRAVCAAKGNFVSHLHPCPPKQKCNSAYKLR